MPINIEDPIELDLIGQPGGPTQQQVNDTADGILAALNTSENGIDLTSPVLSGVPTAATAAPGTNTLQLATAAFVTAAVAVLASAVSGVTNAISSVLSAHLADTANPHATTKTQVGLGNVDNTADAGKPVSTAQQTALNLKANIASPTFTGTVGGVTASMVGLGNVDNTSDANKPVSTAQQTALNLKAPLASPTFTGTVAGVTKAMVGLGSADDTSDANKPVSTAQLTALNLKAPLASPTFTGIVTTAGQIAFPAVQNPSANANTLDDYEEGTWTPVIIGLTVAGAGTYSSQVGNYTKVGNRVLIDAFVTWSAHTGTGDMALGTIPFAAVSQAPASIGYNNLTFTSQPQAIIGPSVTTRVSLRQAATGAAVIDIPIDTAATISVAGNYIA